ncbi:MAG TPA: VTT domain-containing protein [Terriglobia bacterium]|jgi:membrane protein DedA with SNARE-associated domain/rhodanese-related sulfurtransferase
MQDLLNLVARYGYALIFGATFIEHLGLPLPAVPVLIGVGALSRSGQFSITGAVVASFAGSILADVIWYQLGRRYGRSVLNLMCRISLEPDHCVRRAEDTFAQNGVWSLLFVKFVPGLNAAAVPLSGMIRIPPVRFFLFDGLGLLAWVAFYVSLGWVFSRQIELAVRLSGLGGSLLAVIVAGLALYVGVKYVQRRQFLGALRGARITADELKTKLDEGGPVTIVDLRNQLDRGIDRVRIPGAFHMLPDFAEIDFEHMKRTGDIVLYCSCPNEATSAKVAAELRKRGLISVRPLEGGLSTWRELGYPVESLD